MSARRLRTPVAICAGLALSLSVRQTDSQGAVASGGGTVARGELVAGVTVGQSAAGVILADSVQILGGFRFLPAAEPGPIDSSRIRLVMATRALVGAAAPGDTARSRLVVRNAGLLNVNLSIASDAAGFRTVPSALSLAPGMADTIVIEFAPTALGEVRGQLVVTTLAGMEPLRVRLAAYGGQPPPGPVTIDFALGPGDQGVRRAGNAAPRATYTAELHVADAPPIDGWSVVLDLPPSLRYVPGSFAPSSFIPGLVALADAQGRLVELGGTTLAGGGQGAGDGMLGSLRLQVTEAFADSAVVAVAEVTLSPVGAEGVPQLVRSVALISAGPPAALPGDFTADGTVDFDDFFAFADAFGTRDPRFDLDGSGVVDFRDFFRFADFFGTTLAQP